MKQTGKRESASRFFVRLPEFFRRLNEIILESL